MEAAVECEVEVEALAKRSIGPGRRHGVAVREREPFNRSVERASVVVGDRETGMAHARWRASKATTDSPNRSCTNASAARVENA